MFICSCFYYGMLWQTTVVYTFCVAENKIQDGEYIAAKIKRRNKLWNTYLK